MTDTTVAIGALVDDLSQALQTENLLLREGRLKEALVVSETREALLTALEQDLLSRKDYLPISLRPMIERLLLLNKENASLLQAVLAGHLAAKQTKAARKSAAGYGPDGTRLFPATETKAVRF